MILGLTKEERENLIEEIEKLSYLKDDERIQVVVTKLKQNYREEILKIKNWSLEDLVAEKIETYEKEYEIWLQQNGQKLEQQSNSFLKDIEWLIRPIGQAHKYRETKCKDFNMPSSEELIEYFKTQKEKYDGVTEEELDEYVSLLAQKKIYLDKIKLKECECKIKKDYKHVVGAGAALYTGSVIEIEDIGELPEYLKEAKKRRKRAIGETVKVISIMFPALFGFLLLTKSLKTDFVSALPLAVNSLPFLVALIAAVLGVGVLSECLENKKIEKELKESDLYDLYLEAIIIKEEMDSKLKTIEEKGMVK